MTEELAFDTSDALAAGYAALSAGDAAAAHRAFDAASRSGDEGHAIEGLARTAYLELDFARAIDEWKQAYSLYRVRGDQVSAVRAARTLAFLHGSVLGDWAVMNGWIARGNS